MPPPLTVAVTLTLTVALTLLTLPPTASPSQVNLINIYPATSDAYRAIEALGRGFGSSDAAWSGTHTIVHSAIPMPATLDVYEHWLTLPDTSDGPDVLPWFPLGVAHPLFSGDYFEDVTDIVAGSGLASDIPPIVSSLIRGTVPDGRAYGVPLHGSIITCVYRRSVFDALGLSSPGSLSQLYALCAAAKAAGIPHCLASDAPGRPPTQFFDMLLWRMAGSAVYSSFARLNLSFEDARVRAALSQLAALVNDGLLVPKSQDSLAVAADLASNTSAIFCGFSSVVAAALGRGVSPDDIAWFPFPTFDLPEEEDSSSSSSSSSSSPSSPVSERSSSSSDGDEMQFGLVGVLGIPKTSNNKDAARAFLAYAADAEVTRNMTLPLFITSCPVRTSLAPDITSFVAADSFAKLSSGTRFVPPTRVSFWVSEIASEWFALLDGIIFSQTDQDRWLDTALPSLEALRLKHVEGVTSPPVPSLAPGTYVGDQILHLASRTEPALIIYTTDSSPVTNASELYRSSEGILLSAADSRVPVEILVRAVAVASGLRASAPVSYLYVIEPDEVSGAAAESSSSLSWVHVVAILASILCVFAVFTVVGLVVYRRQVARNQLRIGATADDWVIDDAAIKLGDPVGKGAFGMVYSGVWRSEHVAVKRMHKNTQMTREHLERFLDEAGMTMRMRHTNVVLFFGVVLDPPSIVTEFMDHGSLYDVVHNASMALTPGIVTRWTYEIARGLQFLERSGVVHGDMKSPNVLLDSHWVAKLADFGVSFLQSKVCSTARNCARPSDNRSADGTLYWCAPELFSGGLDSKTTASDAYALGITIWEMMTRRSLYPGRSPAAVILAVHKGERPPLSGIDPRMDHLAMLAENLWEQEPSQRIGFADVLAVLKPLVDNVPIEAPSVVKSALSGERAYLVDLSLQDGEALLIADPERGLEAVDMFHSLADELAARTKLTVVSKSIASARLAAGPLFDLAVVVHTLQMSTHTLQMSALCRQLRLGVGRTSSEMAALSDATTTPGIYVHRATFALLDKGFTTSRNGDVAVRIDCGNPLAASTTLPPSPSPSSLCPPSVAAAAAAAAGPLLKHLSAEWVATQTASTAPSLGWLTNTYVLPRKGLVVKEMVDQSASPADIARMVGMLSSAARVAADTCELTTPIGVCVTAPHVAYTVPYFANGSLVDIQTDGIRLGQPTILVIAQGVVRGLIALHSAGMIHGALSPKTIMFGPSVEDVRLVEFGLHVVGKRVVTVTTAYLPLARYSSPEELIEGTLSAASDIFVVGTILYELVTGAPLFSTESSLISAQRIAEGNMPPLLSLPAHFARLITACWTPDPQARPDAPTLLTLLSSSRPPSPPSPSPSPSSPPPSPPLSTVGTVAAPAAVTTPTANAAQEEA